eukprot:61748-Prorocentrum_minimum.AAC.2
MSPSFVTGAMTQTRYPPLRVVQPVQESRSAVNAEAPGRLHLTILPSRLSVFVCVPCHYYERAR